MGGDQGACYAKYTPVGVGITASWLLEPSTSQSWPLFSVA